jgi:UDPglucose 6-dehydrogenase
MRDADAVVVATEWPEFALLDWEAIAPTMRGRVVADARRIVDVRAASAAGLEVISLGVAAAPVQAAVAR